MSINFNIVKKPKKVEEDEEEVVEEEEEIEDDVEDNKPTSSFDPKKKMIKFMGIIVVVMIVIILILFIASSLGGNKSKNSYSYSEIEAILVKAAKSYFKDHSNYLPEDDGDVVEVDHANLVAEGKMKDLSNYTKDGVSCTATVKVEKENKDYLYTPNLNCGDSYSTINFYEKIKKDNDTVTSGYGLYSIKGNYIFRGEVVDNYVSIEDELWRIVKITSNNNVVLVSDKGLSYTKPWDNRYNEETRYESGKNTYSASRIKEYLDKIYKAEEDSKEYFISNNLKSKLVSFNVCTGKRSVNSESKDNSEECLETLKNQKIGLITLSDYMMASIDPNCKSATTKSCKNYNYLVTKNPWWLLTGSKTSSSKVYMVATNGTIKEEDALSYAVVRPVIYLDSDVMYKSGKGTLEKPYKIR